jgi:hypothetical protein
MSESHSQSTTSTHSTSPTLAAAQQYYERGWQPLPVPYKSKNPGFSEWQHFRCTYEELPAHFNGKSNIGLLMGEPSRGLLDVDLDDPRAGCFTYLLPPTGATFGRNGKPGSHWLYAAEGAVPPTKQYKDGQAMLVELRSTGSHSMSPPSVHPSGEQVRWEKEGSPARVPVLLLSTVVAKIATGVLLARHWPEQGSRHEASMALAGGLLGSGWSEDDTRAFIAACALSAGDEESRERAKDVATTARRQAGEGKATGWTRLGEIVGKDVVDKARDWLGATGQARATSNAGEGSPEAWGTPVPFDQAELPSFSTAALPPWLRDYAEAMAEFSQTPVDLPAMLGLAVLALCAGRRVWVNPRPGYDEPACLFVAVALPPGTRKSSVFRSMLAPVLDYEKAENKRLAPLISEAHTRIEIAQKRLEMLKTKAAKAEGEEAETAEGDAIDAAAKLSELQATTPVPVEMWMQDATPEAVGILLANQGESLAALSDEGGIFKLMAGRYSNGISNLDVYLQGHAGSEVRVRRVGREPVYLHHPALTVGLAVQPHVIAGLAGNKDFLGEGLLARFLYSIPPDILGTRKSRTTPIPEAVKTAYAASVQSLLALPMHQNEEGEVVRHRLAFSAEADRALTTFADWVEPQLKPEGELAQMRDWGGKLTGAIARIAACLHLATGDPREALSEDVRVESVTQAKTLARYLIAHAKSAYALMSANPALADAQYVLAKITEKGEESFTRQDAWKWTKGRFEDVEPLKASLVVLTDRGYIRERVQPPTNGKVGRPASPVYEVNPALRREWV